MNSTLRIEVCRVFARMWRNCSPIAFYRAQTTVKFLSKWIDSPIRLPFQIVCVWKPTIDGIGGRFSVREHSSRFFNFASANRNASERTLSIDTKTRTGNENENENEAEGGNDSLNADNDNPLWLLIHTHSACGNNHYTPLQSLSWQILSYLSSCNENWVEWI